MSRLGLALAALLAAPRPAAAARGAALLLADGVSYGDLGAGTPALSAFAAGAAVFSSAYSPSSDALASVVGALTSMQPSRHGVWNAEARLGQITPEARTLGEVCRDAGWKTAAFMGGLPDAGLSAGLDVYVASSSAAAALEWLRARRPDERFLLVMRAGGSPKEADAALAPLLRELSQPRYEDAVVAVASPRGETPRTPLAEDAIHVPLLLKVPGGKPAKVAAVARLVDVMPTLLDYAGLAPDASLESQMDGLSLRPLLEGGSLALDAFVETKTERALVTRDGWKAVLDVPSDRLRLYRPASDPAETKDLSAAEPEQARSLGERLRGSWPPRGLDAEGLRDGAWKALRRNGKVALYDLSSDPYLSRDLAGEQPARVARLAEAFAAREAKAQQPSEALKRKLREAGYW